MKLLHLLRYQPFRAVLLQRNGFCLESTSNFISLTIRFYKKLNKFNIGYFIMTCFLLFAISRSRAAQKRADKREDCLSPPVADEFRSARPFLAAQGS